MVGLVPRQATSDSLGVWIAWAEEGTVIHLDLTTEEKRTLIDVLGSYLSEIRMEIADTDSITDFKEGLKAKKEVVAKILDALRKAVEAG